MSKQIVNQGISSQQARQFILHLLESNEYLQKNGKRPNAVNIEGHPGIGKTSLVEQIAEEKDLHFVKINLGQLEELSDLIGMPIKEYLCTDGAWIPEAVISSSNGSYVVDPKNPHPRLSYATPYWLHGKKGKGGILLLDDYSRAQPQFQQACMEIISRQEYISWKLPEGWTVVLTTNPDNGSYMVQSQDSAQTSRYSTISMKWDLGSWIDWAITEKIDNRCINFVISQPELFNNPEKVNPRSAVNFFNSISCLKDFKTHLPRIKLVGESFLGEEFVNLFINFINQSLDAIPDFYNELVVKDKEYRKALDTGDFEEQGQIIESVLYTVGKFTCPSVDGKRKIDPIRLPIVSQRLARAIVDLYQNQPANKFGQEIILRLMEGPELTKDSKTLILKGILKKEDKLKALTDNPKMFSLLKELNLAQ